MNARLLMVLGIVLLVGSGLAVAQDRVQDRLRDCDLTQDCDRDQIRILLEECEAAQDCDADRFRDMARDHSPDQDVITIATGMALVVVVPVVVATAARAEPLPVSA